MENIKINNGTIDLGLDDNKVRRVEPREEKKEEDYSPEDYRRIMDEDDWRSNCVVDLDSDE